MKTRVNKNNKNKIIECIVAQFSKIANKNTNIISLIDMWHVQFAIEDKFNISDYMSQKLTWEVLKKNQEAQNERS